MFSPLPRIFLHRINNPGAKADGEKLIPRKSARAEYRHSAGKRGSPIMLDAHAWNLGISIRPGVFLALVRRVEAMHPKRNKYSYIGIGYPGVRH
jgi:hypothetical protein